MANYNDFTNDEYLIFNSLLIIDFLVKEVEKFSDESAEEIQFDTDFFIGKRMSLMSDDDVKDTRKRVQKCRDKIPTVREARRLERLRQVDKGIVPDN